MTSSSTGELLKRYHRGEGEALGELLGRHLDWLTREIHRRMTPLLRREGDTVDYLGTLIVRVLERGPRFVVSDEEHFRRLLLVMIRNTLVDGGRRLRAEKRDPGREKRIPTRNTVLYLDGDGPERDRDQKGPATRVDEQEEEAWIELALELIPAAERRAIEMHEEEGMTFAEIAGSEGLSEEGARQRYRRGLGRLLEVVRRLRQRQTLAAIDQVDAPW